MLAINIFPVPAFPVLAFILQFHKNPCDGQMLFSFVTHSGYSVTQGKKASFGSVWFRNPIGTASSQQGFLPRPVQLWLLTGNCGRTYPGWFWTICFLGDCSGSAGQWRAFRAWSFPALWLNHGLFGWEGTAPPAWAQGQHPQAAQSFLPSGLENFQGWKLHSFSEHSCCTAGMFSGEMFLFISSLSLQFQFMAIVSHSSGIWKV